MPHTAPARRSRGGSRIVGKVRSHMPEVKVTELYEPTRDDLWFRQALMADPETCRTTTRGEGPYRSPRRSGTAGTTGGWAATMAIASTATSWMRRAATSSARSPVTTTSRGGCTSPASSSSRRGGAAAPLRVREGEGRPRAVGQHRPGQPRHRAVPRAGLRRGNRTDEAICLRKNLPWGLLRQPAPSPSWRSRAPRMPRRRPRGRPSPRRPRRRSRHAPPRAGPYTTACRGRRAGRRRAA